MKFLAVSPGVAWAMMAAALITVVGLYLLRPSPRRIAIASSVIWQRVLKAHRRDNDRWRWWLSLALACLIAAAGTLAFTQPEWSTVSGGARRLLIVMDTAPSLAARTQDGRTRWQHAVDHARSAIEAAGAGSHFMVLDTRFQSGTPAWETRGEALAHLGQLSPGLGRPSFPIVPDTSVDARTFEALFITDGVANLKAPKDYRTVSVFERASNIGITAFEVRPQPADPRRFEAFLEVFNASSGNEQPQLVLTSADGKVLRQDVLIPGNGAASAVIDVTRFGPGPVRAAIVSGADAFDADNSAYSFVPAKSLIKVALVTRGNPVLERALRLQPRLALTVRSSPNIAESDGFDAVIFDRIMPSQAAAVPALYIRPDRVTGLPATAGAVQEAAVNVWDSRHPVMENLSLRDVVIERSLRWKPEEVARARAVVLASDAAKGALIIAAAGEPHWAAISFDLSDSNLPLQGGFPVILSNILRWLTGETQALVRSPGSVEVPLTGARVLGLDGKEVAARALAQGTSFDASTAGFYTLVSAERVVRVAVNLFDTDAVAINRSTLSTYTPPASGASLSRGFEPWRVLVALALALLLLEWVTYHRKVTV